MKNISILVLVLICHMGFPKDRPQVTPTMREIFNSLMNLQPYALSQERFADPKNKEEIERDIKIFSQIKHAFPAKMKEEEPGIAAFAAMFGEYVQDVSKRYHNKDFEYARHRIRTAPAFCLGCHTRVSTEKNFEDFQRRIENGNFKPFEKAELYAATRQFDKSLMVYDEVFSKVPQNEMALIEFTRGMRRAMNVLVRVKKDPDATLQLLDKILKRKDLPEFVHNYALAWKKDVQFWKEDKPEKELSPEAKVEKAKQLIVRAQGLQSFPADENGDLSYLRASNLLHEALDLTPKGAFRGEALYHLGVAYYALQDPMLWDLDRLYFESCIREFPKSDISKKCYRRYSEKIYLGYTGSSGTNIPEDELNKLIELRKLSE